MYFWRTVRSSLVSNSCGSSWMLESLFEGLANSILYKPGSCGVTLKLHLDFGTKMYQHTYLVPLYINLYLHKFIYMWTLHEEIPDAVLFQGQTHPNVYPVKEKDLIPFQFSALAFWAKLCSHSWHHKAHNQNFDQGSLVEIMGGISWELQFSKEKIIQGWSILVNLGLKFQNDDWTNYKQWLDRQTYMHLWETQLIELMLISFQQDVSERTISKLPGVFGTVRRRLLALTQVLQIFFSLLELF